MLREFGTSLQITPRKALNLGEADGMENAPTFLRPAVLMTFSVQKLGLGERPSEHKRAPGDDTGPEHEPRVLRVP